jgi:hypothetical protein
MVFPRQLAVCLFDFGFSSALRDYSNGSSLAHFLADGSTLIKELTSQSLVIVLLSEYTS